MAVLRSIYEGFGILYFDTKTCIFCVQSSDVPEQRRSRAGAEPELRCAHRYGNLGGGGSRVGYRGNLLGNKKTVTYQAARVV